MSQERTFTLVLKNDQQITLKFNSIEATGDRLWQMFATTEALDTVEQIINMVPSSIVNPNSIGKKEVTPAVKKTAPKKKK
jgi:hypothetical protein